VDFGTTRLIARKEGGIGWMIFNQPEKHNAVTLDMWAAIPRIIAGFDADPEVRVIVLRGAGERAFVSGADISEFERVRGTEDAIRAYDRIGDAADAALLRAAKPTIAMIRGICFGGGVGIALATDLRICSTNSTLSIPAAKLGVGYGYAGIRRLVDIVGPAFAKEIFFSAGSFTAEDARIMGLVNRVVAPEEIEDYVTRFASTISGNAPLTIRAAKLAIDAAVTDSERRRLEPVEEAVSACLSSSDYVEGRRAFMEKRKPAFKGR
jgi:enoyl-CoA hydratase/carnithine racemase